MDSPQTPTSSRSGSPEDAAPLRVPIAVAAERGVSWLNDLAAEQRVVLTKYGRPAAVIDSAERLDATARLVDDARREVVERMMRRRSPGSRCWSISRLRLTRQHRLTRSTPRVVARMTSAHSAHAPAQHAGGREQVPPQHPTFRSPTGRLAVTSRLSTDL